MNLLTAFEVALVVIGATVTAMAVVIVGVKGVRMLHAERLARLEAEVRPAVLAALADGGPVEELGRQRRDVAADIATSLLPKLRGADRDALTQLLVDQGVVADAVDGLRSRSAARRQRSTELLGNAGWAAAEREIAVLLDDRDADVRAAAARALGKLGCARSAHALFDVVARRRVSTNTASMAILRIGADAAGPIRAALDRDDRTVRAIAAELTGSLGLLAHRAAVESLLDDAEATVRVSAARALGRLAMPGSVPTLIRRLEVELARPTEPANEEFVVALIGALGNIGDRRAIPVLESALMRRRRLSAAAASALAGMGARRTRRSIAERAAADVAEHDLHPDDRPAVAAPPELEASP